MRVVSVIVAAALLMAGCGGSGIAGPESESPTGRDSTNGAEEAVPPIDPAAVCELLVDLSVMPQNDESEYVNAADAPDGDSVRCSIEPSDWGETAALGEVGRDVLQLQFLDEENLDLQPGEGYESGRPAGDYQIEESDEPVHGDPARWPDSVNEDDAETFTGHRYEYRFESKLPGTWMRHEILFLIPGSDGSELDHYRSIAFDIFTAYMDRLAAELQ